MTKLKISKKAFYQKEKKYQSGKIFTLYKTIPKTKKITQTHNEKYQKSFINHAVNNVHNIFGTRSFKFGYCFVHDCLDLDSQI